MYFKNSQAQGKYGFAESNFLIDLCISLATLFAV